MGASQAETRSPLTRRCKLLQAPPKFLLRRTAEGPPSIRTMLLPSTIFDKLGPVGRRTCLVRSPSGIPTPRPWSCLSLSTFLFSKMTKEPKAHGGTSSVIVVLLFVETAFRSWGPTGILMTAVTAGCLLCSQHVHLFWHLCAWPRALPAHL